jgi:hypothetical protein
VPVELTLAGALLGQERDRKQEPVHLDDQPIDLEHLVVEFPPS